MEKSSKIVLLFSFFLINECYGREKFLQQGYNQNTDFLSHETSGQPLQPKRDYVAPQVTSPKTTLLGSTEVNKGTGNYVAPQVPVSNSNPSQNIGNVGQATTAPKRDFVNPQYPTQKTPAFSNSGNQNPERQNTPTTAPKRDYVAPPLPTKSTPINNHNDFPPIGGQSNKATPPRRDYVNPQFPSSTQPTNFNNPQNKVKDLVNFYDNKAGGQSSTTKLPSYSSILTGTTGINKNITPLPSGSTPSSPANKNPNKPLSFSDAVSGNKPNAPLNPNSPTYVPKNPVSPGNKLSTTQPGSPSPKPGPVLPSTILQNQNKNSANTNSNDPTDLELQTLSEELLRKDSNNAAKYLTIQYQERTTSQSKEDKATRPLFTVAADVWNIPTIKKFVPLLDNYERDTLVNEYVTPQERNEENAFMDVIMTTSVIRHLMSFLKDKGYVTPDPKQQRDFLKQLWFSLYSRGKGKISSSGFEHIFVSELKNGEVSGLHNWIYFSKEETANRVNYLGYLKYLELNDKGAVLKLHFSQNDVDKPVNSMFIGTSPEFEMAVYTLCFVTRADRDCSLKLGGKTVDIVTHTFRYRSKNLIGSAYPQI